MTPRPNTSQTTVSKADTSKLDASTTVVVSRNDAALARDLIKFAISELRFTIETAEQRKHVPHGLRAYTDEATALLTRLQ